MKITSVILLAHFSKTVSLLNALPTQCAANASNSEKPNTGKVVPIPYSEGMRNREPCFMAIETCCQRTGLLKQGKRKGRRQYPVDLRPTRLIFAHSLGFSHVS